MLLWEKKFSKYKQNTNAHVTQMSENSKSPFLFLTHSYKHKSIILLHKKEKNRSSFNIKMET